MYTPILSLISFCSFIIRTRGNRKMCAWRFRFQCNWLLQISREILWVQNMLQYKHYLHPIWRRRKIKYSLAIHNLNFYKISPYFYLTSHFKNISRRHKGMIVDAFQQKQQAIVYTVGVKKNQVFILNTWNA